MFEEHQYEAHRHDEAPATAALPYVATSNVTHASLLVWGEHCIECAAPSCYTTCDLYDRRPDGRCRRFLFGARINRAFPSFRGYGVELRFRKWGKIEARGNSTLVPVPAILRYERGMNVAFRLLNPVGKLLTKITRDGRWAYISHAVHERVSRYLHRQNAGGKTPDAFLLEVYNPGIAAVTLQLMITPTRPADGNPLLQLGAPPFRSSVVAPLGYSRHEFDVRLFRKIIEGRQFDISLTPESDDEPHLIFLSADFVRFSRATASEAARNVKCVVWDLDNTLWDGVLVEDQNVKLRPGVLQLLQYLDERGILLSIASKNEHDSAWQKLSELGVAHLFLHPQINWMPKSQNVKRIAELLDIGIDTFAFVDDNPFELEEVRSANPDVLCIDAAHMQSITVNHRIQGSTTADARARRLFYQQAIVREQEESSFGEDYLAFLASCRIGLQITRYSPDDLDRIAELVQRTNQLNFSGKKYTRSELYDILEDPQLEKYVLKCADKYGAYGTIGFSVVRQAREELTVEDFMVSCRVQGKFLEQAFFAHLLVAHNLHGAPQLRVQFKASAKNKPAQKVLETLGFRTAEGGAGMISTSPLECSFINVDCDLSH